MFLHTTPGWYIETTHRCRHCRNTGIVCVDCISFGFRGGCPLPATALARCQLAVWTFHIIWLFVLWTICNEKRFYTYGNEFHQSIDQSNLIMKNVLKMAVSGRPMFSWHWLQCPRIELCLNNAKHCLQDSSSGYIIGVPTQITEANLGTF